MNVAIGEPTAIAGGALGECPTGVRNIVVGFVRGWQQRSAPARKLSGGAGQLVAPVGELVQIGRSRSSNFALANCLTRAMASAGARRSDLSTLELLSATLRLCLGMIGTSFVRGGNRVCTGRSHRLVV